jgi:hypothetical protein
MTEDGVDKLIETMFDEVKTVTLKTVNGKPYISDEQTLAEMDFAAACEAMVEAEKRFQRLDRRAHAQKGVPEDMLEWFDALESRYLTDKRLWQLFTAGDRSLRSNKMYNEFRLTLLLGESTRANA